MTSSRWRIAAAFAAVYLIWGSTYLGIRIAIETLPPYLMAATRFVAAGAILYTVERLRGAPAPRPGYWKAAAIVGGLLLFGGNASVVWAEQLVPSGLTALLVAMVPLWMVLVDWLRPGGTRPTRGVVIGLVLGFCGLVVLIGPGELNGSVSVNLLGVAVLMAATLSWAIGSLYSHQVRVSAPPLQLTSMEMLAGGALALAAGLATGEPARLHLDAVSPRSVIALAYLVVFGSIVAFSAYVWLLKVSTPARVSTYAFVNPVVAVFLAWAFAGEALTVSTIIAAAIIVTAVAIITTFQASPVETLSKEPQPAAAMGE